MICARSDRAALGARSAQRGAEVQISTAFTLLRIEALTYRGQPPLRLAACLLACCVFRSRARGPACSPHALYLMVLRLYRGRTVAPSGEPPAAFSWGRTWEPTPRSSPVVLVDRQTSSIALLLRMYNLNLGPTPTPTGTVGVR